MSKSAVASAVSEATEAATKANAKAEKIAQENKSADVTTISLGLSKKAAEYVKAHCSEKDEIGKAIIAEIDEQING